MSVDCYDCEPFDVNRTCRRRARKEHKCCACGGVIERGQLYTYSFTVFEGSAEGLHRCARCDAIYEHLCSLHTAGEDWPDWRLACGHEYRERWGEDPPAEVARLAFMTPAEVLAEGFVANPNAGTKVLT